MAYHGIINTTSTIVETTWNGSTNYSKDITISGATIGDIVHVQLDHNLMDSITSDNNVLNMWGYVTSPDTVIAVAKVKFQISIPSNSLWVINLIKQ